MALRMAMAPALRAFKQIFPFKGKSAPMQYAFRFGPELLGAGMMAAAAPPETSVGTRALIGGEDILASLGLSLLGSGIGRGIARGRMGRKMGMTAKGLPKRSGIEVLDDAGKNIDLSGLSPAQRAHQQRRALAMAGAEGAGIGDMMMMPAQFMRPSPLLNAAHDDYIRKQENAQAQVMTAEQLESRMELEGLMELLLAGGGVAAGVPLLRSPLVNV
jgi:hypothetical protein